MTSTSTGHFQSFLSRPPDPKSEFFPIHQQIKKFWPYYSMFGVHGLCNIEPYYKGTILQRYYILTNSW